MSRPRDAPGAPIFWLWHGFLDDIYHNYQACSAPPTQLISDLQLVGDFMGLGYEQVMYINRSPGGGKVMVVDYRSGAVSGTVRYLEYWNQSPLLNGWLDDNDLHLVGDFMGLGYEQVMHVNRSPGGGKVMVVDYRSGAVPGVVRYLEYWNQFPLLDGWLDGNDLHLVGDFMGLGYEQVMHVNRSPGGGKVMVVDYRSGAVPGTVRYLEYWNQSPQLNGWLDDNDLHLVGDLMGLGYEQVMHVNRSPGGGKVMVVDYRSGAVPGAVRYWESWGQSPLLNGWLD
jgi:hypothetical protein